MDTEHLELLYHLLRSVSNEENPKQSEAVLGLANHLLEEGSYEGLLAFLEFHGTNPNLILAVAALLSKHKPQRLVDIGAGTGWLSRALTQLMGLEKPLCVDKRPWLGVSLLLDLENPENYLKLESKLSPGDCILACNFLHCIENPREFTVHFSSWPMVVIEYWPTIKSHQVSYLRQLYRYGATFPLGVTAVGIGVSALEGFPALDPRATIKNMAIFFGLESWVLEVVDSYCIFSNIKEAKEVSR